MDINWPQLRYGDWAQTCDTLHAHSQLLGKLAVALAPAETQLQHAALRLSARGLETQALPAPNRSGTLVVALDLRRHHVSLEHSASPDEVTVDLSPNRPVGQVTQEVLNAVREFCGPVEINMAPQEVSWDAPLDEDTEHAGYDEDAVARYFSAASQAAMVLAEFRAPFRGRATPVSAWWGSFDLAVNLFSGEGAQPPADDYITRNAMNAQTLAFGWWPGDRERQDAAFYAYAYPAPETFQQFTVPAPGRWDGELGEFILDWEDVRSCEDPAAISLEFGRSVFRAATADGRWDPALADSIALPPLI